MLKPCMTLLAGSAIIHKVQDAWGHTGSLASMRGFYWNCAGVWLSHMNFVVRDKSCDLLGQGKEFSRITQVGPGRNDRCWIFSRLGVYEASQTWNSQPFSV